MVLLLLTLNDPKLTQTTPFSTFCIPFHILLVGGDRNFKFGRQVDRSESYPTDRPRSGHANHFKFWWYQPYLWTAEAKVVKLCTPVGSVKSKHTEDKSHFKKAWSDPIYILGLPVISLERLKLESSNFAYR